MARKIVLVIPGLRQSDICNMNMRFYKTKDFAQAFGKIFCSQLAAMVEIQVEQTAAINKKSFSFFLLFTFTFNL